jgi:membrane associated rhomboid family serine protease
MRAHPPPPSSLGPSALTISLALLLGTAALRALLLPPSAPDSIPPGAVSLDSLRRGDWWSALTWIFTHRDWFHLLSNALILLAGSRLALRSLGNAHFTAIFLLGSWLGALLTFSLRPDAVLIGASGSALALAAASAALHPNLNLLSAASRISLSARSLFLGVLFANIALEFSSRLLAASDLPALHSQAHLVHIAALLTGWSYVRSLEHLRARHTPSQPHAPPPPLDRFLKDQIDPLLEKLHSHGPSSLSRKERALLDEAARRISPPRP